MSWNMVLNKFVEIKNKALEISEDIWAYDNLEQSCLDYWVSLLEDGEYKKKLEKMLHFLELNEHEDFLLIRYANYTDVLSGENESITMDDFLQLAEGDIIKLDNRDQDDSIVKVNGEKKFFARPGTIKNNICVKITEVYDEMHELLRNYF